jgi:hypothetical protein
MPPQTWIVLRRHSHRNTVYALMKRPGFPVLRIRGVVRIPRAEFMAYLAKHGSGLGAQ